MDKNNKKNLIGLTDEELIVFVREENKNAYSFIIDRYHNKIWAYIYRLINDPNDTDDLVQQTFINIYTNINSFNPKKRFSPWIYRIAHNLSVNYLKKKKSKISIDRNEDIVKKLFSKEDLFNEVFKKEEYVKINKLLNELPEKYKTPLILRFAEEKSYEEISEILRIPKNTVGTFINRAEKILRKEMKIFYDRKK